VAKPLSAEVIVRGDGDARMEVETVARDGFVAKRSSKGNVKTNCRRGTVDEVRRLRRHPPARATRAEAAIFAREGDQEVVLTPMASSVHEAPREVAAAQIPAKLVLDIAGKRPVVRLASFHLFAIHLGALIRERIVELAAKHDSIGGHGDRGHSRGSLADQR
jgi:hypothetical protein